MVKWVGDQIFERKLHGIRSWAHTLLCELVQVIKPPCKHISHRGVVKVR